MSSLYLHGPPKTNAEQDGRERRGEEQFQEREYLGFNGEAEVAARDRVTWSRRTNGPILHMERRDR